MLHFPPLEWVSWLDWFYYTRYCTPSCRPFWTPTHSRKVTLWLARVLQSWVAAVWQSLIKSNRLWMSYPRPRDYSQTVSFTLRFPHSSSPSFSTSSTHHSSTYSWREVPVHHVPSRTITPFVFQQSQNATWFSFAMIPFENGISYKSHFRYLRQDTLTY